MKKISNKYMILFLLFAFFSICTPYIHTSGAEAENVTSANFTNLIVMAKFNGESEFLYDTCNNSSLKEIVENSYSFSQYSVKDYYYRVSNHKVNMQNLYLFNQDDSTLTLSRNRGYYCTKSPTNSEGYESDEYQIRMAQLRQDWANTIASTLENSGKICDENGNLYEIDDLDKNKDGYIDSLTIIYKYSDQYSVAWSDCLWNYQSYTNLLELNGKNGKIYSNAYVQLTANFNFMYSDSEGREFSSLKTMIHEMGHIFGLKDLYPAQGNSPVYYMSAMANAITPVPQYISAKEREVLGWLDAKHIFQISNAGTYTINVTSSEIPSEIVCYKLNIPSKNKTLYLEYRKFEGTANKYDSQDKSITKQTGESVTKISLKSGLVCFLLDKDTTFPNNLNSSSNNWNYQVLGGQYFTKTDSALAQDESLLITENLSIKVDSLKDEQLTFTISGNDIQQEGHSYQKVERKEATCLENGNIEYYTCSSCNKYFDTNLTEITLEDTIILAKGHSPQIIPPQEATCTQHGLTQGSECKRCQTILTPQTQTPKLPHTPSDWIVDKEATQTQLGHKHKECLSCKEVLEEEDIPLVEPPPPPKDDNLEENPPKEDNQEENLPKSEQTLSFTTTLVCGCAMVTVLAIITYVIYKIKNRS